MSSNTTPRDPQTLERLLATIRSEMSKDSHKTSRQVRNSVNRLSNVVNHIARYLHKHKRLILITEIIEIDEEFRRYLKECNFSEARVIALISGYRALCREARNCGWLPQIPALEEEWDRVRRALKGVDGGPSIVKDAIARKIPMSEYSEKNLDDWCNQIIERGLSYTYVREVKLGFFRGLRRSGLGPLFAGLVLPASRTSPIRLRSGMMPSTLRNEIDLIVEGMRKDANRGSIQASKLRESTVVGVFEDFCGFGVYEKGMQPPIQFRPLLTESYINGFTLWLKSTAKCQRQTISAKLKVLSNVGRLYPELDKTIHSLLRHALTQIPKDKKSLLKKKKRAREVPHWKLEKIVQEMHNERLTSVDLSAEAQAWLCHDELLMQLLTWYPWPSSCICACRFKGQSPNLFKDSIPTGGRPFAMTLGAQAQFDEDPNTQFWQFSFSAEETLNRLPASGLMPEYFVDLLNEYEKCHWLLTKTTGAETLFLNRDGKPISTESLRETVENLTLRRGHRRVTPIAFRGIFAHYWLNKYPEDYENLAQVLWMSIPSAYRTYDEEQKGEENWRYKKSA